MGAAAGGVTAGPLCPANTRSEYKVSPRRPRPPTLPPTLPGQTRRRIYVSFYANQPAFSRRLLAAAASSSYRFFFHVFALKMT